MVLHVDFQSGGIFSGESATVWDMSEEELQMRFLTMRARGEEVWVQGKPFKWSESKFRVFEGPATSAIPDFTRALGASAYELTRMLTEVTDRYVTGPPGGMSAPPVPGDAVFVVHGSNVARREEVARFLAQVLTPATPVIVLHEQPNRGRTLIEKFEGSAAQAQFAVVLLTTDDEARRRGDDAWEMRARQNVVFELGVFVGKLGRERVAVLYEPGLERPSDIEGLVYIALDDPGAWKIELTREMKSATVDADLNRLN
jgi:hypothetical protein